MTEMNAQVNRPWAAALLLLLGTVGSVALHGQELKIGVIDFYGLRRVSMDAIQRALTFKEGDAITLSDGGTPPAYLRDSERKMSALPGVERVRTSIICCDAGNIIIFVGIEETGRVSASFRLSPSGTVRMPRDVVEAGEALEVALVAAVQRGDFAEDDTQGHALFHDPSSRAIQERFIHYAARDLPLLRQILRDSSDARQRALSAQVLGYVRDKQGVVSDLVDAMNDPAEEVRNNAMRALLVFSKMTTQPAPLVPYRPFVRMLNSLVWTDRNKASGALDQLSTGRDPELLAILRQEALDSLVEMARWKSKGHAMAAFMILGRMVGFPEPVLYEAWERDDRQSVIDAAIKLR